MNTIQVIYQESEKKRDVYKKVIFLGARLFGATFASWMIIFLTYEIICFIGKTTSLDFSVIRAAIKADKEVTMRYRTKSYAVNRLIHELEEMKKFYSQI